MHCSRNFSKIFSKSEPEPSTSSSIPRSACSSRGTRAKSIIIVFLTYESEARCGRGNTISMNIGTSLWVFALGTGRFARWRYHFAHPAMVGKKPENKKRRARNSTQGGPREPRAYLGSTVMNDISLGIHARDVPFRALAELVRVPTNCIEKVGKKCQARPK
jgi:hypothetical protein